MAARRQLSLTADNLCSTITSAPADSRS